MPDHAWNASCPFFDLELAVVQGAFERMADRCGGESLYVGLVTAPHQEACIELRVAGRWERPSSGY